MGADSLIIVARQFIHWCADQSQIIKFWSYATDFLGVKGISWDDLPSDLWVDIGKHLTTRLDILRFRSVCKKWRSSLPCPTRFPLRVPPPPQELRNVPYFITELNMFDLRCELFPHLLPLMVAFEELNQSGKFRTRILLPRPDMFGCPSIASMAEPPLTKLSFCAKAYYLRKWNFEDNIFVKKTVLISSDATSVNPSYASDLTVVAHLSKGEMQGRLALMRLRGSPENWYWDTDFNSRVYEDIATYKGQLCTLDRWGRVFFMDYNSLQMTQVCDSSSIACEVIEKQLCQVNGDLFLIDVSKKKTPGSKAYKLSLRLRKWLKVKETLSFEIANAGAYLIK